MAKSNDLRDPWLVAAWPGMGSVAVGAAGYLLVQLGPQVTHELSAQGLFEVQHVEVKEGLARVGRVPRSMFYEWKDPQGRQDLIVFIGEAQPPTGGYGLCQKLIEYAVKRGVKRFFTFAAMATQLHPSSTPRVFAVANDPQGLNELRTLDVEILEEGQISGLNGVLLAAGAERDLPGVCLLGELPFFAAGVPNPRASAAVLEIFTSLAGIEIDFTRIAEQAQAVEQGLLQLLEKLKEAARQQPESSEESFTVPEFAGDEEEDSKDAGRLDDDTRRRIEALFQEAQDDRSKAFLLKEELDRYGVFKEYEDRFLNLFRKAE